MSVPVVRFARLERRGVLAGLSWPQLLVCGAAVGVLVVAEYTAGLAGVLAASPVWAGAAGVALWPVAGRPLLVWGPILARFLVRGARGAACQRLAPGTRISPRPAGPRALPLPGGPAGLTLHTTPGGAGLVHDPTDGTWTGLLAVHGPGLLLADPHTQAAMLAGWGGWLAGLAGQPQLVRAQLLARTVPADVDPMRRWFRGLKAATGASDEVVDGLLARVAAESTAPEILLAVTVRPARAGRRPTPAGLAAAARVLDAVAAGIPDAGLLTSGWADPDRVARAVRRSHQPTGRLAAGGCAVPGVALHETWDRVRTDGGVHAVYWLVEWPRTEVGPEFLQPLLAADGTVRRTLSLTVHPVPTVRALREIRRAKVEQAADAATRARIGRVEDQAHRAEAADTARREADLVAGHADLRFAGLLTVSAATDVDLDAGCAATETAAARAGCELVLLAGQQAAAFTVGAVPLARAVA